MGLLDSFAGLPPTTQGPGMQSQPQPQGLLAQSMGQAGQPAQPDQGGTQEALQMAQMLSQNPTDQMAQQIISRLNREGTKEAASISMAITNAVGSPQALKSLADRVISALSGQ